MKNENSYYLVKYPVPESELRNLLNDINGKINDIMLSMQGFHIGLTENLEEIDAARGRISYLDSLLETAHTLCIILSKSDEEHEQ